ncbi:MAG: glycosyltransferase family protein [Candidatus Omnitrophota bacterium]
MVNKKQIDVIVEARMRASRLPGKVLMPGCGKAMLHHMVERLRWIPEISGVIIATTVNGNDDCIAAFAKELGVKCFRGSEEDVLGRVVKAAEYFGTDVIVEITGDDPLIAPEVASQVIRAYLEKEGEVDFVTNEQVFTSPLGFNTRAFSSRLLNEVEKKAGHPMDREHVVNYIRQRPREFRIFNIEAEGVYRRPDIRLTLDTMEDYRVIKAVFEALYPVKPAFDGRDIITFLDSNPEISAMNRNIAQKTYNY